MAPLVIPGPAAILCAAILLSTLALTIYFQIRNERRQTENVINALAKLAPSFSISDVAKMLVLNEEDVARAFTKRVMAGQLVRNADGTFSALNAM